MYIACMLLFSVVNFGDLLLVPINLKMYTEYNKKK